MKGKSRLRRRVMMKLFGRRQRKEERDISESHLPTAARDEEEEGRKEGRCQREIFLTSSPSTTVPKTFSLAASGLSGFQEISRKKFVHGKESWRRRMPLLFTSLSTARYVRSSPFLKSISATLLGMRGRALFLFLLMYLLRQ